MQSKISWIPVLSILGLAGFEAQVSAQLLPWITYQDTASASVCDIINANNVELVVLEGSRELTIVTGNDVTLIDTEVDDDRNVFFEGVQAGFLTFAEDGDGFRSLWWVSLTGRVVDVDPFTGEPGETDLFPDDYRNVGCDACDYWDDTTVCEVVEEEPPLIDITFCAPSMILPMFMMMSAMSGAKVYRRRSRVTEVLN